MHCSSDPPAHASSSFDGDEDNDILCGSPDGIMTCPIKDTRFYPVEMTTNLFGNPEYDDVAHMQFLKEAEAPIKGDVTYQVESYTYEIISSDLV